MYCFAPLKKRYDKREGGLLDDVVVPAVGSAGRRGSAAVQIELGGRGGTAVDVTLQGRGGGGSRGDDDIRRSAKRVAESQGGQFAACSTAGAGGDGDEAGGVATADADGRSGTSGCTGGNGWGGATSNYQVTGAGHGRRRAAAAGGDAALDGLALQELAGSTGNGGAAGTIDAVDTRDIDVTGDINGVAWHDDADAEVTGFVDDKQAASARILDVQQVSALRSAPLDDDAAAAGRGSRDR